MCVFAIDCSYSWDGGGLCPVSGNIEEGSFKEKKSMSNGSCHPKDWTFKVRMPGLRFCLSFVCF